MKNRQNCQKQTFLEIWLRYQHCLYEKIRPKTLELAAAIFALIFNFFSSFFSFHEVFDICFYSPIIALTAYTDVETIWFNEINNSQNKSYFNEIKTYSQQKL